ncbi:MULTISPECIES: class 1a ribonucleoside-diphosphate reductase subunit alpha [Stenotrophomonas]|uniref:Ribonucleoside-diphosphate reductase n=1 Tax=Stenotrophomonas maltophilia TaxID=40324 RepID=A0A3S0J120_STEMA|nr:class 1a ribonucleoside-diphosphate reductase subunit alpha [Stenotrophomonas maltophilia]RTQ91511.1 ribonucleoside-diphosphate reductase subunit alpha [Stenotrophomonas maltophilia]
MQNRDEMKVIKRDGRSEVLDLDKVHKVIQWAARGLENVSVSQVELASRLQFFDGIRTDTIHETLIKAAADLISEHTPDYQYLAARLSILHLRKICYGRFEPPRLADHLRRLTGMGLYDRHVLTDYDENELEVLNAQLDHSRDLQLAYAAVKQMEGKYLVQNRVDRRVYETPQFLYMLVSMCLFSRYPRAQRLDYVKAFYDATSLFKISLPTPIMSGVRTPLRQFSSCVLIECDDSLDSINATTSAIVRYVSQRAGIGINAGRIRALGSAIRRGAAQHTGCIPFFKMFQAAVKSCSQGGVRGGAATLFYPLWHLEAESLLVLKNNRGVEENRIRHLDYGIQINRLMYQRLIEGRDITLFSPHDVPELYDAFFTDQVAFEALYLRHEADPAIRKRALPAVELFSLLMQERASTGRIYIQNVDHCNQHGAFDPSRAPIRQSNLCMEITLPTSPMNDINGKEGEIALCTLSAFNLGAIDDLAELASLSRLVVRALDALLDYQQYPVQVARDATLARRSLGVGVINYAYYLARNGVRYSDGSALALTHQTFEAIQFHLLQASMELAREQGACDAFADTRYATGELPIDTYKRDVDAVCAEPLHLDWEGLRTDIARHGLRNSTLTALMPSETSSQIANATNGIEPPRGLVSVKQSKDGVLKQVVPELQALRSQYELLWQMPGNEGYLQLVGVMQKFVDQAISSNTNYDPGRFAGGKVPMKQLLKDLLIAYRLGIKTLYYHNTRDGADDASTAVTEDACASGACAI